MSEYVKVLIYEGRLEIQERAKVNFTFTEIGNNIGEDRTTVFKEVKSFS